MACMSMWRRSTPLYRMTPLGRRFESGQDASESRFGGCGAGIDADFFAGSHFQIEPFKNRRDAGMMNRQVFARHTNAVHGRIGKRNGQCGGFLIFRKRQDEIEFGQAGQKVDKCGPSA